MPAKTPAKAATAKVATAKFATAKVATAKVATAKVATAWGDAALLDQLEIPQRAGDRRFSSIVQLLENGKGERLVRFAYTTDGTARRGPVTLRARDLARLHDALRRHPELAETLGLGGGA